MDVRVHRECAVVISLAHDHTCRLMTCAGAGGAARVLDRTHTLTHIHTYIPSHPQMHTHTHPRAHKQKSNCKGMRTYARQGLQGIKGVWHLPTMHLHQCLQAGG